VLPNPFLRKGKNSQPNDMADFMNKNDIFIVNTDIPKLLLYAKPGMLVNKKALQYINTNISNIETKLVGKAKHLMEEDLPIEIGKSINTWYSQLTYDQ